MKRIKKLENWYLGLKNTEVAYNSFINLLIEKDGKLIVDLSKLDNNIFSDIQEILKSVEFTPEFRNKFLILNQSPVGIKGIWIKTEWYWFGWCKICINHDFCDEILEKEAEGIDLIEFIAALVEAVPELFPFALASAAYIAKETAFIKIYDKGKGIWIGTYAFVAYDVGWGSL